MLINIVTSKSLSQETRLCLSVGTFVLIWMCHVPTVNQFLKVSNRNTKTRCEICSKLTIKTPERRWHRSGVFIVDFEHVIARWDIINVYLDCLQVKLVVLTSIS